MSKSLYEVIGVSPHADVGQIEAKCLELGKKYHVNNNPNDLDAAVMFKEVMLAYSTLRDSVKRAAYDATLKNTNAPAHAGDTVSAHFKNQQQDNKPYVAKKEVSLLLAVAVIFVPFIASWFLLRKGYSQTAKVLGMGWLIVVIFIFGMSNEPVETGTPAEIQARKEVREGVARQNQQLDELKEKQKAASNRVMGTWKSAVKEILVDPNSADFKDVVFVTDVGGTAYACGDVNSKNLMGGYTGYKGFITSGHKDSTLIEGSTKGFSKYWHDICVEGKQI